MKQKEIIGIPGVTGSAPELPAPVFNGLVQKQQNKKSKSSKGHNVSSKTHARRNLAK